MLVELDLTAQDGDTFGSRTTLRFASTAEETFVDFKGRGLVAATLNGVALPADAWQDGRLKLTGYAYVPGGAPRPLRCGR